MVTAKDIPRALNEPVGLRDSSFTKSRRPTSSSGVHPSARVTASARSMGSMAAYRQREGSAPT